MTAVSLLDQLAAHRTVGGVPRAELEWLVAHGEVEELPVGGVLTHAGRGTVAGLYVVLSGRLSIHVDRGAGPRKVMEWQGGDITGILPYSRLKLPPGDVVAQEPTTVLLIRRDDIDAMPRDCPTLTAVAVHVMVDRARMFTSSELLDEKLLSLGRLAAGLAHELNNPASAIVRDASTIVDALTDLEHATRRFCALGLPDDACSRVQAMRDAAIAGSRDATFSSLEIADREDALTEWLGAHDLPDADAGPLADAGITPDHLEQLATVTGLPQMPILLRHLAAEQVVRRLAQGIGNAASRIHTLVAAVKRFTYMDRALAAEPTALGQGLADTITMLGSKAKQKGVDLSLTVDPDLPRVDAFGGELNQVWTNLVDNALDATSRGGRVAIAANHEGPSVVVHVRDTGPGIPAEIQARIFDPFFTTKAVGEGTGLGLDIARRLVLRHRGEIELTSSPAGTEFRVRLPIAQAP